MPIAISENAHHCGFKFTKRFSSLAKVPAFFKALLGRKSFSKKAQRQPLMDQLEGLNANVQALEIANARLKTVANEATATLEVARLECRSLQKELEDLLLTSARKEEKIHMLENLVEELNQKNMDLGLEKLLIEAKIGLALQSSHEENERLARRLFATESDLSVTLNVVRDLQISAENSRALVDSLTDAVRDEQDIASHLATKVLDGNAQPQALNVLVRQTASGAGGDMQVFTRMAGISEVNAKLFVGEVVSPMIYLY
ncbi:hypothetical protein HDU93_002599 [Gonapodya sp. JEL0774]|nr:hypothetical protein HDU93_002599 [Gonapodya sp. JEL0774]